MNLKKMQRELKQPFPANEVEYRVQKSGIDKNGKPYAMVLAYITSRAVHNRLDEVFGMGGWQNTQEALPNSVGDGALCGISIKIDGEWITKYDGAENTNIEPIKGGLSGSLKRAASLWGIGRYLYDLPSMWVDCSIEKPQDMTGWESAKTKQGDWFYWKAPTLPKKFLPQKDILPSQRETINTLLKETDSTIDDYINFYGVDNFVDLYEDEAAKVINSLLRKLSKIKAQEEENSKNEK